jgi:hypothetical protein
MSQLLLELSQHTGFPMSLSAAHHFFTFTITCLYSPHSFGIFQQFILATDTLHSTGNYECQVYLWFTTLEKQNKNKLSCAPLP